VGARWLSASVAMPSTQVPQPSSVASRHAQAERRASTKSATLVTTRRTATPVANICHQRFHQGPLAELSVCASPTGRITPSDVDTSWNDHYSDLSIHRLGIVIASILLSGPTTSCLLYAGC